MYKTVSFAREWDGGLILVSNVGDQMAIYNAGAVIVWDLLDDHPTKTDLIFTLCRDFGIAEITARDDVERITNEWRDKGFISCNQIVITEREHSAAIQKSNFPGHHCGTFHLGDKWIAISAFSLQLASRITGLLGCWLTERTEVDHVVASYQTGSDNSIIVDGEQVLSGLEQDQTLGGLAQVLLGLVHPKRSWMAFIHGAALSFNGQGLIIAAPSGSGKTTLTASLAHCDGFGYLSDDLVAVDAATLEIAPWPTQPSLKTGSWGLLRALYPEVITSRKFTDRDREWRYVKPALDLWPDPVPTRAILFVQRNEGATPVIEPLGRLETLQTLVEDRVWFGERLTLLRVGQLLTWLDDLPSYRLTYDNLAGAEKLLRGTFRD